LRSGKEVDILAKVASTSSNQDKEKNIPIDDDESKLLPFFIINQYPLFLMFEKNLEKTRKIKIYIRLFVDVR
jgi:hypothetical protein